MPKLLSAAVGVSLAALAAMAIAAACAALAPLRVRDATFTRDGSKLRECIVTGFGRTRINTSLDVQRRKTDASGDVSVERSGWPFRCLTCSRLGEVFLSDGSTYTNLQWPAQTMIRGGIALPPESLDLPMFGKTTWRAVPLVPIWSGLIADAFILWAAATVLRRSLAKFRAHLRRRRGECPRCGYALVSSGICPECGGVHQAGNTAT